MAKKAIVLSAIVVLIVLIVGWMIYQSSKVEYRTLDDLLKLARKGAKIELAVADLKSGEIPRLYTCDGKDISPPVKWENLPSGTESLVLICYDPDAPRGTFIHWVIFNIPPSLKGLPENITKTGVVEGIGTQGRNDFGIIGYGGPCPPSGKHRYVFLLLALNKKLDLKEGVNAATVLREAMDNIIGYGEVTLTYKR
ncbi:MAG: YbhB/YbcL family Raf kinase inhibitor-like protein [Thermoprotei archaeon]|nr:MAG: YbhB/YbcL family Raf kinase inhibitor-like protein [Thermoprotei archaeon]